MKLSKKRIAVFGLVALVAVAVYVNYAISSKDAGGLYGDDTNSDKILGDAKLVNTESKTSALTGKQQEYFSAARLSREKSRADALNLLKGIAENPNAKDEVVQKALDDTRTIAKQMEVEANIESLVKAKNFLECLCIASESNISVMVATQGLQPNEVAIIKDIAVTESGFKAEQIIIVEVK